MILERVLWHPSVRMDLEDTFGEQNAQLTDSLYWHKNFMSASNYIMKGFQVTGIGLKQATINMSNCALIFSQNTSDFSYYIPEVGASNIIITDAQLTDNARNYIELYLEEVEGTAADRAFWDKSSADGEGSEYSQQVNTVTSLSLKVEVLAGGFSADPDRIPLCYIDTDVSGNIQVIVDKRPMFYRLGTTANPANMFTYTSQKEPLLNVVLTGGAGTYSAGETVTFTSGATATVVTGGTTAITINLLSSDSLATGDALVGSTSGANRTVVSVAHTFTGGDQEILNIKQSIDAIMTEIYRIKFGSTPPAGKSWFTPNAMSLFQLEAEVLMNSSGTFNWNTGTNIITPTQDVTIIFPGSAITNIILVASFTGATALAADGDIYYVTLVPGTSGNIAITKATVATFVDADNRYIIATRVGNDVVINLLGNSLLKLSNGETSPLTSELTNQILTFIGASSAADYQPQYSTNTVVANNDPLNTAIGKLDTVLGLTRNKVNQKIYIGAAGTGDYTTFDLALAAASNGDTIVFTKGTYAVTADMVVNKSIVIECMGGVIFDGTGGAATKGFQVTATDVIFNLNSAIFQDFDTAGDYAIYVEAGGLRCEIKDGRFTNTNDGDIFAQPDTYMHGNVGSI